MYLLVVPPAQNVDAVMEWLVRLGAGTPYDAKQKLLRGAPFLLPPSDTAHEWAAHLRNEGLPAYGVPESWVEAPPPVVDAARFAFGAGGLEVVTHDGRAFVIAPDAVEAVLRTRRDAASPRPLDKPLSKPGMPRFDPKAGENPCIAVLASSPDVVVRFELGRVDYAGLGDKQTAVVRQNHLALQTVIEHGAALAWKDARLDALAGKLPPFPKGPQAQARVGLAAVEGPFEEATLLLCLACRASRLVPAAAPPQDA